ncbi:MULTISPECIES: bifunctional 4-hydroxy-2-oxoglutarate aldolase/2-dehydro-3-deoxy-phosphogluconate aldolase [unclassified Virgibacillus]|uniref:bifunctional 4-hydroxy-2-oxoglutarate aldolase/2-dehydro-3-deoxy-phosphogluconate aldolase n=1 Tax=unclassified Virgibacillus TaxID=2620237 RepID=UPI0024DDFB3C|nr:bifunctional 4-hydroxy-2-oxoglutarate aldolase/2-dehydro-3-deoxy-phosphogluconate aldolase [Virgibacillus sp. LDC-1]
MKKNELIAIIRGVDPDNIVNITRALIESDITWVEVSLSEEEKGLECIRRIRKEFKGEIHLGVGTVISERQVDAALVAGATYIITPGWDRKLTKYVLSKNVVVFPGVFSPGEIMQAASLGIDTVKVFPAIDLGIGFIKNIQGPFPDMKFMAVGGVTKENIIDFKKAGYSAFAIGSDLVPREATESDLQKIKENANTFKHLITKEA